MNGQTLRDLHRAEPFRPFVMHMADGRSIEARHPEFMAVSPSGRIAVVFSPNEPDDSSHYIDVLMVTDVEVRGSSNGTTPNGSS